jgi:hypothetical protein
MNWEECVLSKVFFSNNARYERFHLHISINVRVGFWWKLGLLNSAVQAFPCGTNTYENPT